MIPEPRNFHVYPYGRAACYQRIPAQPAIDPASYNVVRDWVRICLASCTFQGDDAPVVMEANEGTVGTVRCSGHSRRMYLPSRIVSGGGVDKLTHIQNRRAPDGREWVSGRTYRTTLMGTTITGQYCGFFDYGPNGDGRPFSGAGTGCGLAADYGVIRPEEVRAGVIPHALKFSYSQNHFVPSSSAFRAPATKTDQGRQRTAYANGHMVMGMRLRLRITDSEIASIALERAPGNPAWQRFIRMVLVALRDFGAIAMDGTVAGGMNFYVENNATARWGDIMPFQGSYNYWGRLFRSSRIFATNRWEVTARSVFA